MAADRQPFAAALPCGSAQVLLDAASGSGTSALKGPPRYRGGPSVQRLRSRYILPWHRVATRSRARCSGNGRRAGLRRSNGCTATIASLLGADAVAAQLGDWIVKSGPAEFAVCRPDTIAADHELA